MRVPLTWLREFVPYEGSLTDLAHRLAVSTCEVVRVMQLGVPDEDGNLEHYRVGRVLEAGKHPNADRLQLCRVDVGEGEPRQIVCGAWNFGAGATVAVALPGAVLPGAEQPLGEAKLRGEVSRGMILSERELDVRVDDFGGCPRYVGRLLRGATLGSSPPWLKARLLAAGMRPISNVVDVTNYVMLALGSPLHAFDLERLAGGRIVVRRAAPGERMTTLDGQERRLTTDDL